MHQVWQELASHWHVLKYKNRKCSDSKSFIFTRDQVWTLTNFCRDNKWCRLIYDCFDSSHIDKSIIVWIEIIYEEIKIIKKISKRKCQVVNFIPAPVIAEWSILNFFGSMIAFRSRCWSLITFRRARTSATQNKEYRKINN